MLQATRMTSGERPNQWYFSTSPGTSDLVAFFPLPHVVCLVCMVLMLLTACSVPWARDGGAAPASVYVLGNHGLDTTNNNFLVSVTAVNPSDGHARWQYVARRDPFDFLTQVVTANDRVFISSDSPLYHKGKGPPPTGTLVALRASDGKQLWQVEIGAFASIPVVAGGTVYVSAEHYSSRATHVYALDAATGKTRWHVELSQQISDGYSSELLIAAGTLYVHVNEFCMFSCNRAYYVALRPNDGALLWNSSVPASLGATPLVVSGGRIITSTGGAAFFAYDAANGKQSWSYNTGVAWSGVVENTDRGPLVADHSVFALSTGGAGRVDSPYAVTALHIGTGLPHWRTPVRGDRLLAVDDTAVYVGNAHSGAILALSTRTGQQLWSMSLPLKPYYKLLSHGMLYFTTTDAPVNGRWMVYAVRASDGHELWQANVPLNKDPSRIEAAVLAASVDVVYVVGYGDRSITARRASDGAVKWQYTSTDVIIGASA